MIAAKPDANYLAGEYCNRSLPVVGMTPSIRTSEVLCNNEATPHNALTILVQFKFGNEIRPFLSMLARLCPVKLHLHSRRLYYTWPGNPSRARTSRRGLSTTLHRLLESVQLQVSI